MADEQDSAIAIPTKQFFVSMLTRDISLADAILDLVDNCLDGALRLAEGDQVDYSKHYVDIILDKEYFSIEDNCGGIPRDIAMRYAFKMGRESDDDRDSESETIGMYGVGMKRAIFKIGEDAIVHTNYENDKYHVPITSEWRNSKEWDSLPLITDDDNLHLKQPGTTIEVSELYPSVSKYFSNESFINELQTAIGEHFTIFLQRGLTISVNDIKVQPVLIEVLVSDDPKLPAPFTYQKTINNVSVSIVVGLNTGRNLDDDEVIDFERDRSAATAGWSVFCNDRAVIVGDKSRMTGWGDGIPMYHGQFSVITGIVEFRSSSAEQLPITTTKRSLDTASDVWLEARTKMREALRVWINYTNEWKNHPRSDQTRYWENAKPRSLDDAIHIVSKRNVTQKQDGSVEYNPAKKGNLPKPDTQKPSSRRIVFSRPIDEIKLVSSFFYDTDDEPPGIVGDKCFQIALENAKNNSGDE